MGNQWRVSDEESQTKNIQWGVFNKGAQWSISIEISNEEYPLDTIQWTTSKEYQAKSF